VNRSFRTRPAVRLSPLYLGVLLSLSLPAAHAQAADPAPTPQEAGPDAQTEPAKLGVVVVTAQRRNEALQSTPVAITAVSAADLERKQIRRLDDMKFEVPNVVIEAATGTSSGAKIFMRGIGTDDTVFTTDPSVAIYVDDMYLARATGAMLDMFELERVEVLRGPQGTLYGRNATGGAVRYVTKKPTGESRLEAETRIGNLGRFDLQLGGGTKLGDSVAVSYGLMSKTRGGSMRDITNNRDVNDEDMKGGRVGFAFDLSRDTNVRLSADILRQRSGPSYASGILDPVKAARYGRPVNNADSNLLTLETDLPNGSNDLDQAGFSLTTSTDMGAFEWRNILTYRQMDNLLYIDADGTAQKRYHLYQDQSQSQASYEMQFVSLGKGPLSWTGGLFAFREKNDQPTRQDIFGTGGLATVAQKTLAVAAYGQADWRFDKVWKVTGGLRYSHESKDFSFDALKADGSRSFDVRIKRDWGRADWKLGIDAQFSRDLFGYASVTTGFKSGGFNGRGATEAAASVVLRPETVRTYETGLKSTLADGAVTLNGNVFRNEYNDLQLNAYDANGQSNLTNATSAVIQGIEIEASAQLSRNWQAGMNIGTLDAKYKKFSDANAVIFDGVPLKMAPKLQYGLSTSYRAPLGAGQLLFNAQLKHVGEHYLNLAAAEIIKTEAYTLVDARIAYEAAGNKWSVGLWGRNLTNKLYYAGAFDISGLGIADAYISMPRTFGIDARYRFW